MANILIVDDEERILNVMSSFLSKMGHTITMANNGLKALEILLSGAPVDCMVIDIRMPDMDGLTLVQKLHDVKRAVPMVIVTGTPDMDDYKIMLATMGLSDVRVFNKPVDLFELLAEIEDKLRHK